jgi:Flp pilus assembly pilin Flp
MFKTMRNLKGQSTLEYAILIIIIIAALITLQSYIKRGVQGRLQSSTDTVGDQFSTSPNANYYKQTNTGSQTLEYNVKGVAGTNMIADQTTNTYQHVNMDGGGEYWGRNGV